MDSLKLIKSLIFPVAMLSLLGWGGPLKATLVVGLDLTQSKTIQKGVSGHGSFYQKQSEVERKLRGNLGFKGVRRVQTPHITLFSGITDTPQNRVALTNALNSVARRLDKRVYINVGGLNTKDPHNGGYFYVALNTAIQQCRYGGKQSLSAKELLDSIERELKKQSIGKYHRTRADHASLVEVHSRSGAATSNAKKGQVIGAINKQNGVLHHPNNFKLYQPQGGALWINNLTLYSVNRPGPVDVDMTFKKLHQVWL